MYFSCGTSGYFLYGWIFVGEFFEGDGPLSGLLSGLKAKVLLKVRSSKISSNK